MKNNLIILALLLSVWSCRSQDDSTATDTASAPPLLVKQKISTDDQSRYKAEIEAVLEKSLLRGPFNGAVLVAKGGTIVYEKYVGLQDPRQKAADSITAETAFQIASTGKTITSAAVLKLWEEGKLDLNAELTTFFPGFPYAGVTVKTLLNHRSGLPEYLYYMDKGKWPRQQQATNSDVLKTLITWKPAKAATANKRFQYTNTNYVLLALIVENVSGLSFDEYLKQTFFGPLGMQNSFVLPHAQQASFMQSYQGNNGLWSLDFSDGPYGDKNIYSTPRDLLVWDQALRQGKVLQQKTLDSAYTPYSFERPGVHHYGLGWRLLMYPNINRKVMYHNGHWHGFNAAFSRLPEEDATIIILSNRQNRAVHLTAKKLYDVFGPYGEKGLTDSLP